MKSDIWALYCINFQRFFLNFETGLEGKDDLMDHLHQWIRRTSPPGTPHSHSWPLINKENWIILGFEICIKNLFMKIANGMRKTFCFQNEKMKILWNIILNISWMKHNLTYVLYYRRKKNWRENRKNLQPAENPTGLQIEIATSLSMIMH